MSPSNNYQEGTVRHWVIVRPEPVGRFTAQAAGLPEIAATAATREEALDRLQKTLSGLLASGQLVSIEVQPANPLLQLAGTRDPNNPEEQAFLAELARAKREDLENTLRELDQECSNSSS